jgi:hypothetical protein
MYSSAKNDPGSHTVIWVLVYFRGCPEQRNLDTVKAVVPHEFVNTPIIFTPNYGIVPGHTLLKCTCSINVQKELGQNGNHLLNTATLYVRGFAESL